MKKIPKSGVGHVLLRRTKSILIMKQMIFILLVCNLNVFSEINAQRIPSFRVENADLKSCIKKVEQLTGTGFLYNGRELEKVKGISLHMENADMNVILERLLDGTGFGYEMMEGVIAIRKESVKVLPQIKQRSITGTVRDKNGNTLPGVSVLIKGTQSGVATDMNGNFSISVEDTPGIILQFSFVGMTSREIKIGNQNHLEIVLEAAVEDLDEVVVVAYGTQLKRNVTGSVASVDDFKPQETQVGNVMTGLQGRVSGLWIRKLDGASGASPEFVIRGHQANNLSNQPLIVVDGMIVDSKDNFNLNNIAPQDIESIEVLKDAASSAMYGSRGAMGVIQITTKKGNLNRKPVVNVSAYYGIVKTPFNYRMLNTDEYEMIFREGRENRIGEIRKQIATGDLTAAQQQNLQQEITRYQNEMNALNMGVQEVNWLDELIPDHAAKSDIHMSLSGGNDKTTYYFSVGRTSEDNSVGKGNYSRLSTKLALSNQTYKWLKLSADLSVTRSTKKHFTQSMTVLGLAEVRPDTPSEPAYDEDGNWDYHFGEQEHPRLVMKDNDNKDQATNTTGNFTAEIKLLKGLVWTSNLAGTLSDQRNESYSSPQSYDGIWDNGTYEESGNKGHRITANSFFNYSVDIQKLNIGATLGYEYNENQYKQYAMNIIGFPGIEGLESPANGSEFSGDNWLIPSNKKSLERSESYFFRANLAYDRKYLLSFSIRRDGTSKLAKDNRYSNFPAVSAGWVISDENFMAGQEVVNLLKLRSSFGITGSIANVSMTDTYDLLNSGTYVGKPALLVSNKLGNPDLQWEKTKQVDIGVDLALWQNRINFTVEWYNKHTSGMVNSEPLPVNTGGYTSRKMNSGTIRNRGVDLALNYQSDYARDWSLQAGINMNINRSKVLDLPVDEQTFSAGYYGGGNTPRPRLKIGQPFGSLQMYKALGLDENGDVIYWDASGNGTIGAEDKVIINNLQPKFSGGFNLGASWKGLSLYGQFSFTYGGKIYNCDEQFPRTADLSYNGVMENKPDYILDRWTPENKSSRYPRIIVGAHGPQDETGWNDKPSTIYMFDASFLKLNKLTLSYQLPQSWISKLNMSQWSLYVSGENLFTVKNKNLNIPDPEAALNSGIAQKATPSPRSFMFGFDLTF